MQILSRWSLSNPSCQSWIFVCLLTLSAGSQAAELKKVAPHDVGLSESKLQAIDSMLRAEVDSGHFPGAIAVIARHGKIAWLSEVGRRGASPADGSKDLMKADTLFRIASMTKAITSAAVMSLVEDGAIELEAPISRYLPALADPRVLAAIDGESMATVPAKREPTIHDLLTHRSGYTYGWFGPDKLDRLYLERGISDFFTPVQESLSTRVQRIARLPLKFHPGEMWDYGVSTDILGYIVEVVSGLTLEQFFRERFFRPLQMHDTFFSVPHAKIDRLAGLSTLDEDGKLISVGATPVQRGFLRFSANANIENSFYSGGGGLVSTAADYLRFLEMLRLGGQLGDIRVLSPESVAMMRSNQIGEQRIPPMNHGDGFGFGFGVQTVDGIRAEPTSEGTISWGGIFNSYYWVDPQEELTVVLMVQVFPHDHTNVRKAFRQMTYDALDDGGFERVYRYQQGMEFGNPFFNARQVRVNAGEVSVHPDFASRSEPQSSGAARIRVDEDLRKIRRADLELEVWGGHPGTASKRVTVNGRSTFPFARVGTEEHECTHQYPSFNLSATDLVNGYNTLQFACDQADTFWGHYIVDNAAIRIGLFRDDEQITELGLKDFDAKVTVSDAKQAESKVIRLVLPEQHRKHIRQVHFEARYNGYDENGNRQSADWHGMTKDQSPYGHLGSTSAVTNGGYEVSWDTSMLPAQEAVAVRAIIDFETDAAELQYRTPVLGGLRIDHPERIHVALIEPSDVPKPFWARAGNERECRFDLSVPIDQIESAELHVVAWTGGSGEVQDYFTLNGHQLDVAEGAEHETVYSTMKLDPKWLQSGSNVIRLLSDTHHHGIEILSPGPALAVRYRVEGEAEPTAAIHSNPIEHTSPPKHYANNETSSLNQPSRSEPREDIREGQSPSEGEGLPGPKAPIFVAQPSPISLKENPKLKLTVAPDESADNLPCYRVETPSATYFLDRVGAGLSSMVDREGNDWISFHPKKGSGAAGEYRGFPNAVFQSAGSYFHARNAGTDPCVTIVEEESDERIVISALASNGRWAGEYTFTSEACTFTLTKKPEDHSYWVLYEGTPGGEYDDTDWWMTSELPKRTPLTKTHEGDIPGTEWIAFGDEESSRVLLLTHHEDDDGEDRFYQMQRRMTVFGFGRSGMQKFLNSVPQSFSIQFVESTVHAEISSAALTQIAAHASTVNGTAANTSGDKETQAGGLRAALESYALTSRGNPEAGKKLFFEDQRTRCSVCHQVAKTGGQVGPDLSKIGGKFDRPHLIESLLEPSRQIVEGYRTSLILTEDDQLLSGIVKARSDSEIRIVNQQNESSTVAVSEIVEETTAEVSLMPTGLADQLSPAEFADLVAYLETLQSGKGKFGSGVSGPVELPAGFEIETVATGLSGAVALETAPDGRIFICEQGGKLRVVENGELLDEPFVEIPVEMNWERGLIGVTVSDQFPKDPWVYVVYVTDQPYTHHRVSRFRADGNKAAPRSEEVLLRGDDQSLFGGNVPAGHQGGAIHFGTDGMLYIGLGEQTAGSPSQRFDALQGKILRIRPDGGIPDDNPLLGKTVGKYQSIWAYGCRNPFTFSVRSSDGLMFINDVGGKYEEINLGVAGANYGWPGVDHGPTDRDDIVGPVHIYPQASISGGDFAKHSDSWPDSFAGKYFFADFVHGWIHAINPSSPAKAMGFASGLRRPVDLRFDRNGDLYVLLRNAWVVDDKFSGGTGSLMRIRYTK
ncbi:MAG: serine hydrolase [Aureliella sp.]